MPVPTAAEGHYDQMLTDFSVGYQEQSADSYVADKMFPVQNVDHQSDTYRIYPRGYFLQDQVAPRPMGGVPRIVHYRTQTGNYYCEEEGLRALLDKNEGANWSGPGDPRESKVRLLTSQHMVHRDRKFVQAFLGPNAGWSRNLVGVDSAPAAGQFLRLDGASIDLVDYFAEEQDSAAKAAGLMFNRLLIGRRVLRGMRKNAGVKEAIKYTQTVNVTLQILAGLFDIERILSPIGVYNAAGGEIIDTATGRPIVATNYQFMVGERDMLFAFDGGNPGPDYVGAGVHFAWTGLLGNGAFNSVVNRGTWDYGEWFDVLQAFTPKIVAPDLGVLYRDAVAA